MELLATIKIFKNENEEGSRSRQTAEREYEVELAPETDGEHLGTVPAKTLIGTMLAHELGHIVSQIVGDPQPDSETRFVTQLLGVGEPLIPFEKKAWAYGEEILPQLDRTIERKALETYGG